MILAVDGNTPPGGTEELCTYHISQSYGRAISLLSSRQREAVKAVSERSMASVTTIRQTREQTRTRLTDISAVQSSSRIRLSNINREDII